MTTAMHQRWLPQSMHYDGAQLRSHWIFDQTGLVGDAIVAFIGGARVEATHMVDLEDRRQQAWIFSEQMLHFIVEHFHYDLTRTILLQHLLVASAADAVRTFVPGSSVRRSGNDLFDGDAKLSVSIATASPVSTLIHCGINILSTNTPVTTKGLADYRIDPHTFAVQLMQTYTDEVTHIHHARAKVRAVP